MEIVYKRLEEIQPYERNPRKNDEAVEGVAASIKEFGWKVPIVIDKNGIIVAGHTRYKAAMRLGINEVPCIVADDLNDEQVKAFRIADNKVSDASIWDNRLLLEELEWLNDYDVFTGFDFGEIEGAELLDEKDNSPIIDNEYAVTYECVCRSIDKSKVDAIKAIWEGMVADDE